MSTPKQRPLPDNTHYAQETDIYIPGGIQTRNPLNRAVTDRRLRPRGHRYEPIETISSLPIRSVIENFSKPVRRTNTLVTAQGEI